MNSIAGKEGCNGLGRIFCYGGRNGARRKTANRNRQRAYQLCEKESAWLYDVTFAAEDGFLQIWEKTGETPMRIPYDEVEYLKLRPFYFAICVGFKNFIFYAHEEV